MIKATNNDKENILFYIGKDYGKCLYLYLDILEYGLENENIDLWYQLDADENITALLFRYYTGVHLYSKELIFEIEPIIDILNRIKPGMISGVSEIIDLVAHDLSNYSREDGKVAKYLQIANKVNYNIKRATDLEINDIARLLENDIELGKPYGYDLLYRQLKERFDNNYGRNFVLYDGDKLIAHAGTYAEHNGIAVIGGIIVHPDYRGKGLGAQVLAANNYSLTQEGIEGFGYVYIPSAIKTSQNAGCDIIANWSKLVRKDLL